MIVFWHFSKAFPWDENIWTGIDSASIRSTKRKHLQVNTCSLNEIQRDYGPTIMDRSACLSYGTLSVWRNCAVNMCAPFGICPSASICTRSCSCVCPIATDHEWWYLLPVHADMPHHIWSELRPSKRKLKDVLYRSFKLIFLEFQQLCMNSSVLSFCSIPLWLFSFGKKVAWCGFLHQHFGECMAFLGETKEKH